MAKDLWDEKPTITELWQPLAPWGINKIYFTDDMDAWLEKLKGHVESLEEAVRNGTDRELRLQRTIDESVHQDRYSAMVSRGNDYLNRLKTVKTIIKKSPKPQPVKSGNIIFAWNKPLNEMEYNLWLKELRAAIGE